jgi:FkbM family methyltransferase
MQYWHHLLNDRWVVESVFPGLRGGYFVEAGACTGKPVSATYVLETELGWNGVCVEPVEEYYKLLVRTRRCQTDDRCLWNRTGETVLFTEFAPKTPRSGITEVNKNLEAQRLEEVSERTMYKQTVTLHDLLAEHGAPPTIHYVCLDIEGAERRVLEAFDFREGPHRVLALSIEGEHCDDLMRAADYVRAANPFTDELYEHYFLCPELAQARPDLVME